MERNGYRACAGRWLEWKKGDRVEGMRARKAGRMNCLTKHVTNKITILIMLNVKGGTHCCCSELLLLCFAAALRLCEIAPRAVRVHFWHCLYCAH